MKQNKTKKLPLGIIFFSFLQIFLGIFPAISEPFHMATSQKLWSLSSILLAFFFLACYFPLFYFQLKKIRLNVWVIAAFFLIVLLCLYTQQIVKITLPQFVLSNVLYLFFHFIMFLSGILTFQLRPLGRNLSLLLTPLILGVNIHMFFPILFTKTFITLVQFLQFSILYYPIPFFFTYLIFAPYFCKKNIKQLFCD